MKIIIDAMGGDNAPNAIVKGAVDAQREFGEDIVLVGREAEVKRCLADCGAEVLVHVGLETVGLQGKGFTVHAQNGQKVKKGDLLIEVDLDVLKEAGLNPITPVLICNSDDFSKFETDVGHAVQAGDAVIKLAK